MNVSRSGLPQLDGSVKEYTQFQLLDFRELYRLQYSTNDGRRFGNVINPFPISHEASSLLGLLLIRLGLHDLSEYNRFREPFVSRSIISGKLNWSFEMGRYHNNRQVVESLQYILSGSFPLIILPFTFLRNDYWLRRRRGWALSSRFSARTSSFFPPCFTSCVRFRSSKPSHQVCCVCPR